MMEQQPQLHQAVINERLFGLSPDSTTSNEDYGRLSSSEISNGIIDDGKSCLVCGHVSHGFHFGILACRACAAFFRRTVAENKIYKCRQQCNCSIRKDFRNNCRHCRFNKCIALGMNKNDVQMNRDPIGRRREANIVECCSKPSACCDSNGQIRSDTTDAEMDIDLNNTTHPSPPISTKASVSPLTFNNNHNNLNGLTTSSSTATSAAFTATLANILPHFQQTMQPIPNLPSLIGVQNSPALHIAPQHVQIPVSSLANMPIMPSFVNTQLPIASLANVQLPNVSTAAVNCLPTTTQFPISTIPQIQTVNQPLSTLASLAQQQQQQATMTLLQNATELAAREERERLLQKQNELRLAQTQKSDSPTIALLPYTPLSGPSMLQRLQEGYANYQSSQKSLYTVMYPDNIFAAETHRLVKHSEHVKMERGCLSLMFSMVNDWFQPFDTLDHTLKVLVLRAFSTSFSLIDQAYKTMSAFPEMDDTRFVLHYGQYIDETKLEFFFQEHKDPNASAAVVKEIIQRCRALTNKMRKLQIREQEIAALTGLILWNEVALASNFDNTDKIRDRIYSELHNHIILNYGIMETGSRMGALLCLLNDLNVISKEITESVLIGKILNPHALDLFEEC